MRSQKAKSPGNRVKQLVPPPWSLARRFLPYLLSTTLALAGAAGCAVTRGDLGAPFNGADISAVQNGKAIQSDVVRLPGAPDNVIQLGHREVFHYYHYTLKHATFLVFSRVNIASAELYVFFDRHGVVDQVLVSEPTKTIHTFQVAVDSRGFVQWADFRRGAAASRYRLWPFIGPSP